MLSNAGVPPDAKTPDDPTWRTALCHLGAAVALVGFIALAVALLSLPVQAGSLGDVRQAAERISSPTAPPVPQPPSP